MRRRVTYSRNLTLSLSRTCQCYCKYCAFATHRAHLHAPEEVLRLIDGAARRGVKELLVLTGERPEVNGEVAARLREHGHEDFTAYVAWACERALERGILPHTNLGALSREDLARLREVTASQGLMLESISERLMQTVHAGSPSKHPQRRLQTIRAAGELRIPFTSGILVGIGEREEERIASLEALAAVHAEYGHIQEVILQNFVPHQRYYGREPAEIADAAARAYWRTGIGAAGLGSPGTGSAEAGFAVTGPAGTGSAGTGSAGTGSAGIDHDGSGPADHHELHPRLPLPAWASAVSIEDMKRLIAETRRLMPDVGIQVPPNLADWWPELVRAGATDLGGLSANGDHISPEHPFPSPHQVRKRLQRDGVALTERLCVYPRYIDSEWLAQGVLDTIKLKYWSFIPRRGSGRREERAIRAELVGGAIERGRAGERLSEEELTAMFAETRPEAVEAMRQAADELRAELAGETVTFVVNRNINISNVCTVGCAFCGFGQGRRSPDAYEHSEQEFVARIHDALQFGASELCIQSGIHPDWQLEDYLGWLRLAKDTAARAGADLHLHAYSPMEIAHMCDISGLPPAEVFARLRDAGLGSTPGTAAEVLHDGVRERISPNKLPVARWVEIVEASHAAGLRSTATVMFGHIEEPRELAEHMRVVRALQERTGGITEFVPLSFIPFQTLLGRTHGVQEISRAENLKHTAVFRLALGRTVASLQASWVKMGLDAATEALRWGVNDLGGTLMEESISRLAGSYHGTRLEPAQLVAAAHRAGRPAAERSTLYAIRRRYPLDSSSAPVVPAAAASSPAPLARNGSINASI
jgi:FO synthase